MSFVFSEPTIRFPLGAILNSFKFSGLLKGIQVTTSEGHLHDLRVQKIERYERPRGLRFSKHIFKSEIAFGKTCAIGWGESSNKLIAIQKSISEGLERAVFYGTMGSLHNSETTSGWAAHLTQSKCHRSALEELLERDAIMTHWLCEKPMVEISKETFPTWLKRWVESELITGPFPNLRIFISTLGYLPTVTVAIQNEAKNAVMAHATDKSLVIAISKARAETCRLAHLAIEGHHRNECRALLDTTTQARILPDYHAMVYAHHLPFPEWFSVTVSTWQQVNQDWNKKFSSFNPKTFKHEFVEILSKPIVVGFCKSALVQNLYFGPTERAKEKGLLNFDRLGELLPSHQLNFKPHIVA